MGGFETFLNDPGVQVRTRSLFGFMSFTKMMAGRFSRMLCPMAFWRTRLEKCCFQVQRYGRNVRTDGRVLGAVSRLNGTHVSQQEVEIEIIMVVEYQ